MEHTVLNTVIAVCAVVIALGAFVVSIVSVIVSIWQGFSTRKHNRLSVRPSLRIDRFTHLGSPRVGIVLRNNGIGPAVFKNATVFLNGQKIEDQKSKSRLVEVIERLGYGGVRVSPFEYTKNDPISPGESNYLIELHDFDESPLGREKLLKQLFQITFRIEYESIYGEKFILDEKKE